MFNERLRELISSLSSSECRYFKQYLTRYSSQNRESKFATLFDGIRKSKNKLNVKLDGNLQTRLYYYILESLRAYNSNSGSRIQLFQYLIDYETLLKKGLFNQAWKMLIKAEHVALDFEEYYQLEDVFEKQEYLLQVRVKRKKNTIELQSINQKRKELALLRNFLSQINEYHIQSYAVFRKEGRISRNPGEIQDLIATGKSLFDELPRFKNSYKAHQICLELVRSYMMAGKFSEAMRCFDPITNLYENRTELKSTQTRAYAKFLNLKIIVSNLLKRFDLTSDLVQELRSLEQFADNDEELQVLIFENANFQNLEMLIHQGEFQRAVLMVNGILPDLEKIKGKIHNVNIQSKYYRVALAYFGNGDYKEASKWVNRNMQYEGVKYRLDIQASLEILNLLCHYELGNYKLLDYLMPSAKKRLINLDHWGIGEELLFKLLNALSTSRFYETEELLNEFVSQWNQIIVENGIFEFYPLAYFDLKFWYRDKLKNSRRGLAV